MNPVVGIVCALAMLWATGVSAGTACGERTIDAVEVAQAADTALRIREALEREDAPVALLSRVGTDLSGHGLVYSHLGFVVRDHPAGRWSVVHLLNTCGTDRSSLYIEGLVNFFADDLVNQDARITWVEPALAERLNRVLTGDALVRVHQPRYSVIARFDSPRFQNSTGWALDVLMAAQLHGATDRARARAMAAAQGFVPDHIHIAYSKRLAGGLFAANAAFTDHPVSTRLSGRYPVVTVRAILDHLAASGQTRQQREWRGGKELITPGPA